MSKKGQKALASATIMSLVLTTALTTMPVMAATTSISGAGRVETSLEIAKKAYANWTDSNVAVIANAANSHLVDALAVAPLAYAKHAPIFLTNGTDKLESGIIDALKAQKVTTVYVAGGTVTAAVDAQLKEAGITTVKHLAGSTRFETANAINKELEASVTPKAYAVVNTNSSVADALSVAAIAAGQGYEIVLANDLNTVKADLTGKTVYAIGGSGVLSDALVTKLNATRLGGSTRFETNAKVLEGLDSAIKYDTTYVADGTDAHLVDSLPGSVLAGQTSSPIVLVSDNADAVKATVAKKAKDGFKANIVTLGGSVNAAAVAAVDAAINPVATELKVDSVSATNLKEINITFNKAVDQTTAETAANYTVGGNTVSSAVLNGNTVTLTLGTKAGQQDNLSVTIANVKDLAGNAVATTTKTVCMLDNTVPTVSGVTVAGPTTLKVAFSEPIDPARIGTFTIDNNTYSVTPSADVSDNHVVDLALGTTLPDGSHTVTVSLTKDLANFTISKVDVQFNYVTDKVAPTVSLVSASQNQVKIKFSKVLDSTTESNLSVYHTYNNNTTYKGTIAASADHQTYTISFNGNYLPLGNAVIYVNAGADTTTVAKDLWGNKFVSTTLTAAITADTTAPVVKSVSAVDSTHIDVQYSKEVTGADVASNYTLKDASGTAVAVSSAVVDGTDDTLYHLTTALMNGGSYTLAIANIKDTTLAKNAMAAYKTNVAVKDMVVPTVGTAVTNADDATATKIKLTYSEPMMTSGAASVLDANNYLFNNAVLPTGTTITSSDNGKTVMFTFPTATTLTGKSLIIGHVADAAGNYLAGMSTPVPVTTDAISTINNPVTLSATKVTFEVYQPLSAIDVNKFTVGTHPAATATYVNQKVNDGATDGALVTLTVASTYKWLSSDTPAIAASAGAFTTVFGTASSTVTPTATLDETAPSLDSAVVSAPKTIVLTYDENIKISSVSLYTYTVPNDKVTNANVSGATVTLTLATGFTGTDATSSITQALEIQDIAGNKLAASAAVDVTDGQVPVAIAYATNAASFKIVNATTATVVFSEKLDASKFTAGVNNGFAVAGVGTLTSATLGADGVTVTLTGTGFVAGTTTIAYTPGTLADLEGNLLAAISATTTH